ncbi:unnamed protein product [Kuraishia capsulata CBS 1993]|uniref:Protein arginine N-methyltransferase n=1 Tax=Kuraishia capsulata CBS 1993 TaxID=1382522 RepID=W6MW60_9ASCO|nr:uncharacterized protein KUCA_T00002907001 [Kuraishia capsulata CBS 1993]CDK26930.1 unnamed protein product [Kuraishia capsulata CBS 1993]
MSAPNSKTTNSTTIRSPALTSKHISEAHSHSKSPRQDSTMVKIGLKPLPVTLAAVNSDSVLVENLCSLGYDEVLLPITTFRYREKCKAYFKAFKDSVSKTQALEVPFPLLGEVEVFAGRHISKVVGLLSSWIELDSHDSVVSDFSLQVVVNEVSYASHIGIQTFLLAPPKNVNNLAIYANNLSRLLETYPRAHFSLSLPICEEVRQDTVTGAPIPVLDALSTWDMWNSIRTQCNYHENLSVSLGSPNHNIPQYVINRWLLEPIRLYLVSTSRFVLNSKNYPVLNKFNQLIIWKLIQKKTLRLPTFFLHGVDRDQNINSHLKDITLENNRGADTSLGLDSDHNPITKSVSVDANGTAINYGSSSYLDYLRHLATTSANNLQIPLVEKFTMESLRNAVVDLNSPDLLQQPLQPLQNNLDNATYQTFEKDHVKYESYEKAMVAALMDLANLKKFQHLKTVPTYGTTAFNTSALSQESFASSNRSVSQLEKLSVLIVGPGRGPLIDRLFASLRFLNLNLDFVNIVAIEKNSNVMVYLSQCNSTRWLNKVRIFNRDIRKFAPPSGMRFNLIISELLGSFGCNELSPECLEPVSKMEDPGMSIYIPQSYSSYIAPASSPAIYGKLEKLDSRKSWNLPYVPLVDSAEILTSRYEKLWTFEYPSLSRHRSEITVSNRRSNQVLFKCHHKGTLHGLLGHFVAELYNGVIISNLSTGQGPTPPNLISWLPIFFPLEQPMYLPDDQELSVLMKREVSHNKVWYEWSVESFMYLVLPMDKSRSGDTTPRKTTKPFSIPRHSAKPSLNTPGLKASLFGSEQFFEPDQLSDDESSDDEEAQMRVRTGITKTQNSSGRYFSMFF